MYTGPNYLAGKGNRRGCILLSGSGKRMIETKSKATDGRPIGCLEYKTNRVNSEMLQVQKRIIVTKIRTEGGPRIQRFKTTIGSNTIAMGRKEATRSE